jgi:hypothetical protein
LSRACKAPIGSNTMSAASPVASANASARDLTATCIDRAQNTFSMEPFGVSCFSPRTAPEITASGR